MSSSPPSESESIETSRLPAVSSLKSHFEQIANSTASKKPTVAGLGFPTSTSGLLTADRAVSPRQRTSSGDFHFQVDGHDDEQPSQVHLRSASSSSDLRSSKRPPPPPPPNRSTKPASPNASPNLRSVPIYPLPNPSISPTKRPPPPIPSSPINKSDLPLPQIGSITSIRGRFSSSDIHQPQTTHPPSKPVDAAHQPKTTNSSQAWNEDTLTLPPPLPVRRNGSPLASDDNKPVDVSSPTVQTDSLQDPKPSRIAPPRPPPRLKNAISSSQPASPPHISHTPPPLPARKVTTSVYDDIPPPRTLPLRVSENATSLEAIVEPSPTATERKTFGSLPPPPKRQIGLKDDLPEFKRQPQFSDSSDEEEEEESKTRIDLPDSSRSSRKPPFANFYPYSESHVHVPHNGVYAVAGSVVAVVSSHVVKLFDLTVSESSLYSLDLKDISPDRRSRRPTSLAFRNLRPRSEKASLLWVGTKDGHIFEIDIRSGVLVSTKIAAHAQAVTHIFPSGYTMVTIDDNGKALVFTPDDSENFSLSSTQPRVLRIADKQDFVELMAGKLWTSAREPSATANSSRSPIVRVYDIHASGSSGRSLLPIEHVGTVTCGTVLPSNPGYIYLGHEGGTVTIWILEGAQGAPECIDVVKVSMSDILCLAGVNDRLWSGSRVGHISAYDASQKPWVMTNSWVAHKDVPVTNLSVDPWSILSVGKLCAVSIGRDEKMRFWDGLLAVSWIDHELMTREEEYSSYRELSTLIVSWNVDANKPDALTGDPGNIDFLKEVLTSARSPDIISIGFQEVVDLENRKVTAKSVLLGNRTKAHDGTMSQKVSTSYKKWYDHLVLSVRLAHHGTPYHVIHSENLVGLFSCIFVKVSERASIKDAHLNVIKRGMRGNFGNKGAIVCRLVIDDSSLCFINSHLAAGQHQVRQRGRDVAAILEERALFPEQSNFDPRAFVTGGDGTMVLDHEIVFFSGDMNYRIDARREMVIASIRSGEYKNLQAHDQLLKEMRVNRGFRLRSFQEGPINFVPTYKYDPRTNEFDTSAKKRIPAWCDRILWRVLNDSRVVQTQYRRWEADISDHRPISAVFNLTVKSVNPASRADIKSDIEKEWEGLQQQLLSDLHRFYVDWGVL